MIRDASLPCDMPIKIIGKNTDEFKEKVPQIVHKHFPKTSLDAWSENKSEQARFTSLTVTVYAETEEQLKTVHTELKALSDVAMVL